MHTTIGWVLFSRYGTIILTRSNLLIVICIWGFLCLICLIFCHSLATILVGICFAGLLLTVSFTDYMTLNIPHEFIGCIGVLACTAFFLGAPENLDLANRWLGSCIAMIPLLICAVGFNGFGGGDIKLMAVIGFLLGDYRAYFALFLALIVGISNAIVLLLTRKITRKDAFPFAPALSIGSFIAFLL